MNFSEFGRWSAQERAEILDHCADLVEKGAMPLESYARFHPNARLNDQQQQILTAWLRQRAVVLADGAALPAKTTPPDTCDAPDAHPRCCFAHMPEQLSSSMQIAAAEEAGDRIILRGQVFKNDGRTPYPGVLLYAYHTDVKGIYSRNGKEQGIQRRHGRLHGWLRTDAEGRYELRTIRPAAYPERDFPAHIHAVVWEPGAGREPYYIEDFLFADDPLLQPRDRASAKKEPLTTHVVTLHRQPEGLWIGKRNIVVK